MCCLQGQIQLPFFQPLTRILHNYLTGDDYSSREFRNNIQQYNAAFAMTSVGVKIDNSVTRQSGPYCFKIQGELHHLTGALLSHDNHPPTYAQIYICHKLHLAISPPILRRFSRSQQLRKALEKTFQSVPVTPRSNQYWPRY